MGAYETLSNWYESFFYPKRHQLRTLIELNFSKLEKMASSQTQNPGQSVEKVERECSSLIDQMRGMGYLQIAERYKKIYHTIKSNLKPGTDSKSSGRSSARSSARLK
jgi:hypothetical protein